MEGLCMRRTCKDDYFLDIAMRCAEQGTCKRRNYGAVIVDGFGTIVSTGYSGSPHGTPNCCDIPGECWREKHNVPSGLDYTKCFSVHAEWNALLQAGKLARCSTMYISGYDVKTGDVSVATPCFQCAKMLVNSDIDVVIIKTSVGKLVFTPMQIFENRKKEIFG